MAAAIAKHPPRELFKLSVDQWTAAFWEAAAQHRLVVPRCCACGTFRMPPTPFCPECQSQGVDWIEVAGQGTIYSYSIITRATVPSMADCLPYIPALITLEEAAGVRLVTNIVDVPVDGVHIGARVCLVWADLEPGVSLPRFTFPRPHSLSSSYGDSHHHEQP
jgi:uncharacterized protein